MDHPTPSTPGSDPAPAPQRERASARPSVFGRLLRGLWPVLCVLQLGLLIGGYFYFVHKPADEHAASPPEPSRPAAPPKTPKPRRLAPPAPGAMAADMEAGDRLFRSGRYDLALPVYQAFGSNAAAPLRDLVQYRVALCLEGLGRWAEATAAYRNLLTQTPQRRVVIAAEVGLGRVWLHSGQTVEARNLMCRVLRRAAADARLCPPALEEAHYLLALALAREAAPSEPTGPPFDRLIEVTALRWPFERALAWAEPAIGAEAAWSNADWLGFGVGTVGLLGAPLHSGPLLVAATLYPRNGSSDGPEGMAVQRVAAQPEESLIRLVATQQPVVPVLDELAARCGLKALWSARALKQTEGHLLDVHVAQIPFEDLARNISYPLGLVWKTRNGVVSWSEAAEFSAEDLGAFRMTLARRALREAVAAYPEHDLAVAAYFSLGNLEAQTGQLPAAAAWYEQVLRDHPRSQLLVETYYNLGLIQHRLGHEAAARQAFYRVVDQAPGHVLVPQTYLAIGRTWLDEGRPDQAISPLRRAVAVGGNVPAQPVIVVTLAASYLWVGNPRAANTLLLAHRAQVNQPPYRQTAAFLDALSRFEAAGDRRQTRHASDLLTALLALGEPAELGSLGILLIGQAYRELGMIDQMTAVYEKALRQARGPVAEEMTYSLATALANAGKMDEAKKLLLALAVQGDSRWIRAAKLRLADLALKEQRPTEALSWCRQLLPVQPPDQLPALLELMGRAFEQTGDYEQAARCFRGERPS